MNSHNTKDQRNTKTGTGTTQDQRNTKTGSGTARRTRGTRRQHWQQAQHKTRGIQRVHQEQAQHRTRGTQRQDQAQRTRGTLRRHGQQTQHHVLSQSFFPRIVSDWKFLPTTVSSAFSFESFQSFGVQELCESRGGRPGLSGLCGRKVALNCSIKELKRCVNVEVAVLGSLSLIVLMVSDAKQH